MTTQTATAALARRIAVEKRIVKLALTDILAAGYSVRIADGDGEGDDITSRDLSLLLKEAMACDEVTLRVIGADDHIFGSILLVYGNDGYDVISDYSANPLIERLLTGAQALAERIANGE